MPATIPIKVALRARPLIGKELHEGCESILDYDSNQLIFDGDKAFTYDYVFGDDVKQSYVYENSVMPLVDCIMEGYNATVLAYGQTGSGKTHTMGSAFTNSTDNGNEESYGVIPRVIKDIFDRMSQKTTHLFCVKLSYLEIYKEEIKDLFRKSANNEKINIRDGPDGSAVISGLTEISVKSSEETFALMDKGNSMRSTAATAMNATSSRSHAVFTILLESKSQSDDDIVTSRFHLVDLAGSERANRTKASGERFDEGVQINKGLLALGNVISALGNETKSGPGHVGYRNSKLTRLLQDSLGGNSRTVMIACVSPADSNMAETLNTLRYADRVRKIKNKPIVNRDPRAQEVIQLKQEVQRLRLQIVEGGHNIPSNASLDYSNKSTIRQGSGFGSTKESAGKNNDKELITKYLKQIKELENCNKTLTEQLQESLATQADICENNIKLEIEKEFYQNAVNEFKDKFISIGDIDEYKDIENIKVRLLLKEISNLKKDIINCNVNSKEMLEETMMETMKEDESMEGDESTEHESTVVNGEATVTVDGNHDTTSIAKVIMNNSHALRTAHMSKQLHELSKALAMKEELAKQMNTNDDQLRLVREQYEDKINNLDKKILATEKEKQELNVALRLAHKTSEHTKISEQRRKRLQELEAEIQKLKKEKREKEKMVKLKQQSDIKVNKLNSEIHQMKSCRVKLMRQIKIENEKYKVLKKEKDREVKQLQQTNRKRQFEITKWEQNFNKQQAVLRRKTEEASSAKKRLNAALLKQRSAAEKRENVRQGGMNGAGPKVRAWCDEEIEVIVSINSVQHHLDILLEDRKTLQANLEASLVDQQSTAKRRRTFNIDDSTKQMKEEIALKNAQIKDFQRKLADVEEHQRKNNKWASITSMTEARCAMKYLMGLTVKSHGTVDKITEEKMEIKKKELILQEEIANLSIKIVDLENAIDDLKHENLAAEKVYQEKVLYLMSEINAKPEPKKVNSQEDYATNKLQKKLEFQANELKDFSKVQSELQLVTNENKVLKEKLSTSSTPSLMERSHFFAPLTNNVKKVKKTKRYSEEKYVETFSDIDEDFDDEDSEEDYIPTPLKKKFNTSRNKNSGCGCLSLICGQTKRCKCTKLGKACGEDCRCLKENCKNRSINIDFNSDNDSSPNPADSTFTKVGPSRQSTYTPTFFDSPLKEIVENNNDAEESPIKPRLLPAIIF